MNGIIIIKDNIQAVYDNKGAVYEIPNYCINPPYKFIESSFEQSFEDKPLDIRIRQGMTEYKIHITTNTKVGLLKEGLKNNMKDGNEIEKIRLFYNGKELKDNKRLQKVTNNGIVQMATFKKEQLESARNHYKEYQESHRSEHIVQKVENAKKEKKEYIENKDENIENLPKEDEEKINETNKDEKTGDIQNENLEIVEKQNINMFEEEKENELENEIENQNMKISELNEVPNQYFNPGESKEINMAEKESKISNLRSNFDEKSKTKNAITQLKYSNKENKENENNLELNENDDNNKIQNHYLNTESNINTKRLENEKEIEKETFENLDTIRNEVKERKESELKEKNKGEKIKDELVNEQINSNISDHKNEIQDEKNNQENNACLKEKEESENILMESIDNF